MTRSARFFVAAALCASGCASHLLDLDDASAGGSDDGGAHGGDGGASGSDANSPPDLANDSCATHVLAPVALTMLERLDDEWRVGAAMRIAVEYQIGGCDFPGQIDVTVVPGDATDSVTVTANAWKTFSVCSTGAQTVRRVVVVSDAGGLSSPNVLVHDGAPFATRPPLAVMVRPPAGQSCNAAALGKPCVNDCECQMTEPRARCIPIRRGADVAGLCSLSCSDDGDCDQRGGASAQTVPSCGGVSSLQAVCGGISDCSGGSGANDCPAGWECRMEGSFASCRPTLSANDSSPCSCDTDCAPEELCDPSALTCVRPCASDGDCPGPGDGSWVPVCAQSRCGRSV